MKITDRQMLMLRTIANSVRDRGYPPTMREIGDAMSIRSTKGVSDHLKALEKKSLIVIGFGSARAITLTEMGRSYAFEKTPDDPIYKEFDRVIALVREDPQNLRMQFSDTRFRNQLIRMDCEIKKLKKQLADHEKPCVWTYAKDGLCTTPHNGLQLSAGMGPRCIECGRRVEVKP